MKLLNHLKVSGFRSLNRFDIDFSPGLNVLVGPNGAGKTNIIDFLQFISHYFSSRSRHAIGRIGGARKTFSTEAISADGQSELNFTASGYVMAYSRYPIESHASWVRYQCDASIKFDRKKRKYLPTG